MPTTVAPSISSLSPGTAAPGGAAFTLTVNGTDFKNGAVVKFGNSEKITTFLSATQLSAPITASEIATTASVPVIVTNPDGQSSAARNFTVQAGSPLPGCQIISSRHVPADPVGPGERPVNPPEVTVSVGAPRPEGTFLAVEKRSGSVWEVIKQVSVKATETASPSDLVVVLGISEIAGDVLRVRLVNGDQASNYSTEFLLVASP